MSTAKRLLLAALAMGIAAPLCYWLAGELIVLWEMRATGAGTRSELANDLGLGLLFFMWGVPATVLGTLCIGVGAWIWSGPRRRP